MSDMTNLDCSIIVPKELTAENGAKKCLIGEFSVDIEIENIECTDDNDEPPTETISTIIPWTTIKQIHRRMIDHVESGDIQLSELKDLN